MSSQATITISPDGKYIAAQVHQHIVLVDASTGAAIDLPAPVFTRTAEVEGDDSDDEGDDADDGDAPVQPKKKAKAAATAASASRQDAPKPIRVLVFNATSEWMMYQSDDKYIHVYHVDASYAPSGFKHILTVSVAKKVQAAVFHPDTSASSTHFSPASATTPLQVPHLLVADKTGDVLSITGVDLQTQAIELGHLSNVTGLEYFSQAATTSSPSRSYCVSSDSDGKIRVSNAPFYFDIQAFCLGHAAFVSAFSVVPAAAPVVVSGGLGSEVRLWNLIDGAQLATLDLAQHKPTGDAAAASSEDKPEDRYVSQVSHVATNGDVSTVLVSVYPWLCAFLLSYTASTKSLAVVSVVPLPTTAMYALVQPTATGEAAKRLLFIDETLTARAWSISTGAADETLDAPLAAAIATINSALAPAQAAASDLLITRANESNFIGDGTDAPKYAPTTDAGKARAAAAAAAGHTGRYVSPFSSIHVDHLMRLSMLSTGGFAFRRHADKVHREAYIQSKKAESAARREAAKADKATKKKNEQRKRKEGGGDEEENEAQ